MKITKHNNTISFAKESNNYIEKRCGFLLICRSNIRIKKFFPIIMTIKMKKLKGLYLVCMFLFIPTINSFSQKSIKVQKMKQANLPKEIGYKGKIKEAIQYSDASGQFIVLFTETGVFENKNFSEREETLNAELFAYHFDVSKKDSSFLTWRVYDYIHDCDLDLGAEFLPNAYQITDLDQNGLAEIWILYKTVCHGDVSPWNLKIIMYEGSRKYAMRGESKIYNGKDENGLDQYFGGEYKVDHAFETGPPLFLAYAKELWEKNCLTQENIE